ncbi:MAG: hypothetical protein WCV67_08710 [Victivallaceae bacterium]|jgi:hypothetical protein
MSIFEITMLICFGASWPLAIYKTVKAKNPVGKSVPFLYLVLIGYFAGCMHKVYYNFDKVFWLYTLNAVMVLLDLILTHYYIRRNRRFNL